LSRESRNTGPLSHRKAVRTFFTQSMIPKSGTRFSEKIMLHKNLERDDEQS